MKEKLYEELNTCLTDTFDEIQRIEERGLQRLGRGRLSIVEFHLLECVSRGDGGMRTVGEIADAMSVTLPTVTVAVNRLESKGYITKRRCDDDRRVIRVSLTDEGKRMNRLHEYFHEQMIYAIRSEFSEEEMEYVCRLMSRLNRFFREKNGE